MSVKTRKQMRGDRSGSEAGLRGAAVKRRAAVAAGVVACGLLGARPAPAQYTIEAASGDTVRFESPALRVMLDTARALYRDLETDPRVGYIPPAANPAGREPVSEENPEAAYPWNAVTVLDDSTADVMRLPANLREADRAYYNYAVMRMRVVRGTDPDVPCDSLLALEEKVVGSFIDGWILSRTLFGGPAFAPLDELVFAREAGLLRPLLARRNDRQIGACAGIWADEHPDRVAAYDTWRSDRFPPPGDPAESTAEGEAGLDPAAGAVTSPEAPREAPPMRAPPPTPETGRYP